MSFTDGHAPNGTYLPSQRCSWSIPAPVAPALVVDLRLALFLSEATYDVLRVHAGNSEASPLLGHITGHLLSAATGISATGGATRVPSFRSASGMFITWTTDDVVDEPWPSSSQETGFRALYDPQSLGCNVPGNPCQNNGTCVAATGLCQCAPGFGGADCSFDGCMGTVAFGGSGTLKHAGSRATARNDARCRWVLTANAGSVVELTFKSIGLEAGFDFMTVWALNNDYQLWSSALPPEKVWATWTGRGAPQQGLRTTIPNSRFAVVEFTSNGARESSGFEIEFASALPGGVCKEDLDCKATITGQLAAFAHGNKARGVCDTTAGTCSCDPGYYGANCEFDTCIADSGIFSAWAGHVTSNAASTYAASTVCAWRIEPGLIPATTGGTVAVTPTGTKVGRKSVSRTRNALAKSNSRFRESAAA